MGTRNILQYSSILIGLGMLMLGIVACGGDDATPTPEAVTATAPAANSAPTATIFISSSGGGRRAATLVPTAAATTAPTLPPTEIASATPAITTVSFVEPTETAMPLASSTTEPTTEPTALPATLPATLAATPPPATSRPLPTATPVIASGVYVTSFQLDPPAPKSKPAQFQFHVGFLNTVGQVVNYPRWRVLIFPKGQTKAQGDPQGASKSIANGASNQDTEMWSIKVISNCEAYTAQPIWQDEDGRQTPFKHPDGTAVSVSFQVCP